MHIRKLIFDIFKERLFQQIAVSSEGQRKGGPASGVSGDGEASTKSAGGGTGTDVLREIIGGRIPA